MSDRNKEIIELREKGVTYADIAKRFSISPHRVRQIHTRCLKVKLEADTAPPLKKMLPPRLQNALVYYFNDKDIFTNPEKIKTVPLSELTRKAPMIGKISIEELTTAMVLLGYVKEEDEWLEEWYGKYKTNPWRNPPR